MKKLLWSVGVLAVLASCKSDDDTTIMNQDINYSKLPQEFPFTKLATINGVDVINGDLVPEPQLTLQEKVNFMSLQTEVQIPTSRMEKSS